MSITTKDLIALETLMRRIYDAIVSDNVTLAAVEEAVNRLPGFSAQVCVKKTMPSDGEVFEITHDFGENPEPNNLPNRSGYGGEWLFDGKPITGVQTRRFMWVWVGPQQDLDAVRASLTKYGTIPEGQWLEAIKKQFEPSDWHGIADSSWVNPTFRHRSFPCLDPHGSLSFCWANDYQSAKLSWLVEVK